MKEMWFWLAMASAALTGVSNVLDQKILEKVPVEVLLLAVYFLCGLLLLVVVGVRHEFGQLKMLVQPGMVRWFVPAALCYVAFNFCLLSAIHGSNATWARLVEVSYPFFAAIGAWVLLGEMQVTGSTVLGWTLIVAGVVVIGQIGGR